MKIKEIGEFGLIARLAQLVEEAKASTAAPGFRLVKGIGDDAALWEAPGGMHLLTTDTVVLGIHFTLETTPWRDLGWKVMAANLSDVAAMGGVPTYAVATLGLPPDTAVADVEELYRGMLEACFQFSTVIVGGDVVRSSAPFVTIALEGVCPLSPLRRDAARQGDVIAVSGYLGSSAGGLAALQGAPVPSPTRAYLIQSHRRPTPRLKEGQALASLGIRCAMDISDGLVDDLGKLCLASGVAATVVADDVPVHPLLQDAFPKRWRELALGGGEDYELVFTGPRNLVERALRKLPPPAAIIGRVTEGKPGQVTVVGKDGHPLQLTHAGWDHFR